MLCSEPPLTAKLMFISKFTSIFYLCIYLRFLHIYSSMFIVRLLCMHTHTYIYIEIRICGYTCQTHLQAVLYTAHLSFRWQSPDPA